MLEKSVNKAYSQTKNPSCGSLTNHFIENVCRCCCCSELIDEEIYKHFMLIFEIELMK